METLATKPETKHKEPSGPRRERPAKRGAARHAVTSIHDALNDGKVEDVLTYMRAPLSEPNSRFIEVNASDSMTGALAVLAEHKVHGAPVFDAQQKKHIGFVDSFDIMAAAIKIFEASGDHAYTEKDSETDDASARRLQEELMISELNARNLSDCSNRDHWVTFSVMSPLLPIAKRLSEPNVHRVGIEGKDGKLIGVITQSALCEYIYEEHYDIVQHLKERVSELSLPGEIQRVKDDDEALVAFQLMIEKSVSGLPVVNSMGVVVDTISHADFSLWNEWVAGGFPLRFLSLDKLHLSVREFLQSTRAQAQSDRKHGSPVTCKPSDKIEEVLGRMLEHNVHRCIVIDEGGAPLSVVSFGTVLGLFTKEASK